MQHTAVNFGRGEPPIHDGILEDGRSRATATHVLAKQLSVIGQFSYWKLRVTLPRKQDATSHIPKNGETANKCPH